MARSFRGEARHDPRPGRQGGRLAALLCASVCLLGPLPARAQESCRARLRYQNDAGVESCPTERELRSAVAARLGYDPFCEEGRLRVQVVVGRQGQLFVGEISLQEREGAVPGRRRIAGDYPRCELLASALTLAISIAIDPLGAVRGSGPEPAPAPVPVERPFAVDLGAGAAALAGSLPGASLGLSVAGRASWSRFAVELEGQASLPVTAPAASGRMKVWQLELGLAPCLRGRWLSSCAVLAGGVLRAEGQGLSPARQATAATLTAGVRGELELPLREALALRVRATLRAPLLYAQVTVDGAGVWRTPPLAGSLGALLSWRL